MFDRYISNRLFAALKQIPYGSISITTPDGQTYSFKGHEAGADAEFSIHDWRVIKAMLQQGDIGLAETYREGWWDSSDLKELFLFGLQNQQALDGLIYGNVWGRMFTRLAYFFSRNSLQGSKKNIHAHYDLGNEFYQLWLDPSMTYSSALFADKNEPLQGAQLRKYDRMLDRLGTSGSLLEIGCGWGGFVERALQKGDYGIKALTISKEQHAFAEKRVAQKAVIALEDYRQQTGLYDQIVSIEMFEAVGEKFWSLYFAKLKSLLARKGKAMVQTITIADAFFERYRTAGDPIRSLIFPGGMLPSPEKFRLESAKAGLIVSDAFSFGQDYFLTLSHWLANFDAKVKEVKALGFDESFIRLWRFYLTSCMAVFQFGRTDVIQWELQHA